MVSVTENVTTGQRDFPILSNTLCPEKVTPCVLFITQANNVGF